MKHNLNKKYTIEQKLDIIIDLLKEINKEQKSLDDDAKVVGSGK